MSRLVEAEALGQVADLEGHGTVRVNPGQPVSGRLGDAGLGPLFDGARRRGAPASEAWERGRAMVLRGSSTWCIS